MFSRFTKPSARKLIVSSIYGGATLLAVANLAVYGSTFTMPELAFVIPGVALWGLAAGHSIYRKCRAWRHDKDTDAADITDEMHAANDTQIVRESTHSAINASLHIASSSLFFSIDTLTLLKAVPITPTTPSVPILICRDIGSGLWILTAGLTFFTALAHDRKQEDNPNQLIKPLGVHPAVYNLISEETYFGAGILYAYAIYAYSPINPIKACANSLWLIAGGIGSVAAIYELINRSSEAITAQNQQAIEMSPAPQSHENSCEYVIEIPRSDH